MNIAISQYLKRTRPFKRAPFLDERGVNNTLNIFVWKTFRSGDILVCGTFLRGTTVGDLLVGGILAGALLRGHRVH